MGQTITQWKQLDKAIESAQHQAFSFLERLVSAPSSAGNEAQAQQVVEDELKRLGFEISRLPLFAFEEHRPTGFASSTDDRTVVVGRKGECGRSLLINGHVDVVPPGAPELWSSDPFLPTRTSDGWLVGRGAGDMKGGLCMATLALEGLQLAMPDGLNGSLTFVSVPEEECTGNGTLSAAQAGVLADAVVLPEPTGLELLLSGMGVLWLEITVYGLATHAETAERGVSAIDASLPVLSALRALEVELRAQRGGESSIVNVGTLVAGDWPSSVPAVARLGVRMGFPRGWTSADAFDFANDVIAAETRDDAWLSQHPPKIARSGLSALGYELTPDAPPVAALADAHRNVFGSPPSVMHGAATTDARFYVNESPVPAFCYGPRARNIHGIDEAVELASIVDGARVLARFIATWLSTDDDSSAAKCARAT